MDCRLFVFINPCHALHVCEMCCASFLGGRKAPPGFNLAIHDLARAIDHIFPAAH